MNGVTMTTKEYTSQMIKERMVDFQKRGGGRSHERTSNFESKQASKNKQLGFSYASNRSRINWNRSC